MQTTNPILTGALGGRGCRTAAALAHHMLSQEIEAGAGAGPEQEHTPARDESKSDCSQRPPLPVAVASFLVTFQLGFAMAALNSIEMVIVKWL